jgi:hypothetical protein
MRSRSLLPVAGTIAAVTAIAVTVALVQPSKHDPRPLRLAAGGSLSGGTRDAAMAAGSSPTSGSGYTLTGTLPAGQPDDAPAYTLPKGPADADVVAALARALHAGTPVRDGDGWRAGGLFVSGDAGQSWWWAPCAADTVVRSGEQVACASPGIAVPAPSPVDGGGSAPNAGTADGSVGSGAATPESSPGAVSGSGGTGTGTAIAPPPAPDASPVPEPSPMSEDAVRAAVQPLFDALGLDLSKARVEGWPYGGSATLTRTVGGLEAYGLQTSVQVDRDGTVQSAGGFLGVPDKGDSYPLVTAQAAYDDLPPMVTTMLCPVSPDGKGCGSPAPTEITGARLGLMMQPLASGEQALVPAWLFEVKGWTEPLAVVAVQAKYLATDEPTDPATVKPDPSGGIVPPAPPPGTEPDPGATRSAFGFDKASRGTSTDEVVVTYGDSSSCPHENVTHVAKEDSTTVYVGLQADAQDPGTACTDDYRIMNVVVKLQAPLGDRKVVDVSTGKAVPLS